MENVSFPSTESYMLYTLSSREVFISTFLVEKIYKIVITIIGLIGNGATIIILTNKRNKKSSTAIYLTALAVSDILILIFGPFCDWLEVMWNVIIKEYGGVVCRLQTFMQYSSSSTSSWLLAAVTIEKALSVMFPYWVRSACTIKSTYIVILITWIMVYAINMHFLFGMGHMYNKVCDAVSLPYMKFSIYVLPWIDFCLCFAIPFILISIGNVIIVHQLAVMRSRRKFLTNSRVAKHLSVPLILVMVNIVFTVTVGPIYTFWIIFPYLTESLDEQQIVSLKDFWGPILNGLWEMNAALNMVLYILSGSKFRNEVKHLLCCSKRQKETGVFDNFLLPVNRIYMLSSRNRTFLQHEQSSTSIELQHVAYCSPNKQ